MDVDVEDASPKSQLHDVMGSPIALVEASLNKVLDPAQDADEVNAATGI